MRLRTYRKNRSASFQPRARPNLQDIPVSEKGVFRNRKRYPAQNQWSEFGSGIDLTDTEGTGEIRSVQISRIDKIDP